MDPNFLSICTYYVHNSDVSLDIRNWCPGRSVLVETNLWLKDFAQMHKSIGVRSAIQSLAGIYIYDYLPLESIRLRVNQRFFDAEARFSRLLQDPATATDEGQANELITIAVILSMQDVRSWRSLAIFTCQEPICTIPSLKSPPN